MKNLELLIPREREQKDVFGWATVTDTSPLRIRLDGESTPLEATPDLLVSKIEVGDRVWYQMHGRRLIVLGTSETVYVPPTPPKTPLPSEPMAGIGSWADYTPILKATNTDPDVVPATGRYRRDGDTCFFEVYVDIPSTSWNRGDGSYQITLPVPPKGYGGSRRLMVTGEGANVYGNAAVAPIENDTGLLFRVRMLPDTGGRFYTVDEAAPGSWLSGYLAFSGSYRTETATPAKALYVVPHQDDEILTMGSMILQEVQAGTDVTVMITSRGESSGARTSPELFDLLGYTPTEAEFSAARDREFAECVWRMGATPLILPWEERYSDGSGTSAFIQTMIQEHADADTALRATGPTDYHVDHRACGDAVEALAASGFGTDHRLCISDERLPTHSPAGVVMFQTGDGDAISGYLKDPYLMQDVPNGWWGIGGISVQSSFNYLTTTSSSTWWHTAR